MNTTNPDHAVEQQVAEVVANKLIRDWLAVQINSRLTPLHLKISFPDQQFDFPEDPIEDFSTYFEVAAATKAASNALQRASKLRANNTKALAPFNILEESVRDNIFQKIFPGSSGAAAIEHVLQGKVSLITELARRFPDSVGKMVAAADELTPLLEKKLARIEGEISEAAHRGEKDQATRLFHDTVFGPFVDLLIENNFKKYYREHLTEKEVNTLRHEHGRGVERKP